MKQVTQSSFNEGLLMDMNPLVTPQTCLTDCLNGTIITFNGNEFTLQNDSGNVMIEGAKLPNGFIPVGMKEYGGIIYTALLNPVTNMCQIGSIPSPDYSKIPKDQSKDGVKISFNGNNFKNNITKLFEFDQLVLNPGDEYKIMYSVLPIEGKDISNIYDVKWLAIDESGKEYTLKNPNVIKKGDVDKFTPFNQTIRAVLGLEITLNTIDWFEVSGQSIKNKNDKFEVLLKLNGKNKLKSSTGTSNDDLYIRGCKVECLSHPYNTTYFWNKEIYDSEDHVENPANPKPPISESLLSDRFEQTINVGAEFQSDTELTFAITPFDQFKILDELKRTIFLKTGEVYEIAGLNDLFQYKYSSYNKSLRLDFNASLKGMDNAQVYLEFYDVWSNYSIIIPINDPNPFGKNSVFISTSSEKCIQDFNDITRGGIETRQLSIFNNDSEYKPTIGGELINGTSKKQYYVRKNQILRENNLYIVKIAIVENKENELIYHNTYKVFTLNENMNDKYEEYQLNESPEFKDFSIKSQKTNSVKINSSINEITNDPIIVKSDDSGLTIKTDVNSQLYYYKLLTNDLTTSSLETCTKNITKRRVYDLSMSLDSDTLGYGIISSFNLDANTQIKNINTNIVETDESIKTTESSVNKISTSLNNITIENILQTSRKITAEVKKENRNVRSKLRTSSVWDTLITGSNESPSGYIQTWGNRHHPRRITLGNVTNIIAYSDEVNSSTIKSYFSNGLINNNKRISGGILYWNNTPRKYTDIWGGSHDHFCTSKIKSSGSVIPTHINNYLICLRNKDGNYYPVFTSDSNSAKEALKNIFTSSIKNTDYRLYYYGNIESDKESTSYTKPEFILSGTHYITFIQHAHYYNTNFNQNNILQTINNIINDSEGTVDNKYISLESDKYLQIINTTIPLESTITLDNLEITDGVDKSLLNKLTTSKTDLEFNEASKLINSTLPDQIPYSNTYPGIASKFDVTYESSNGESVNPIFTYKHANLQKTLWAVEGDGSGNDKDGYDIDISIFEL